MASRKGTIERMAAEKNKVGRPPGVPTQKNKMLREMIEEFTDGNFNVFVEKMGKVDKPDMYAELYLELLSFRMPKLKSVDFKGDIKSYSLEEKLKALHQNSLSQIDDEPSEEDEM